MYTEVAYKEHTHAHTHSKYTLRQLLFKHQLAARKRGLQLARTHTYMANELVTDDMNGCVHAWAAFSAEVGQRGRGEWGMNNHMYTVWYMYTNRTLLNIQIYVWQRRTLRSSI